jgi:hypothetical protein
MFSAVGDFRRGYPASGAARVSLLRTDPLVGVQIHEEAEAGLSGPSEPMALPGEDVWKRLSGGLGRGQPGSSMAHTPTFTSVLGGSGEGALVRGFSVSLFCCAFAAGAL